MKIFFVLFTFIFFSTQILPVKYLQYLYSDQYSLVDTDEEKNTDDNPCEKAKEKFEKEIKFFVDNFPQLNTTNVCSNNYFLENIVLFQNHICTVLTPPPNA